MNSSLTSDGRQRAHEREVECLTQRVTSIETHARALEFERDKLSACLSQERDRYDALDRKYNDILLSGGANKLSHFSKIKE